MSETVVERLRPDAWVGWTDVYEEIKDGHEDLLVIAQDESRITLTVRTARELVKVVQDWTLGYGA